MITRFAPSPTGPLHLGHAYSALLAFDLARATGGRFLLRIEDIDSTRSRPKWEELIYEDLRWLGLSWEDKPIRQSDRLPRYRAALEELWNKELLYPCSCNRKDILEALSAPQEGVEPAFGPDGLIYPGTCRDKTDRNIPFPKGTVLRLDMAKALSTIGEDAFSFFETGEPVENLAQFVSSTEAEILSETGDIILSRKDFPGSYHLSVVLDDADQNVTDVVRGADLFEATKIHIVLQKLLGLPPPRYHHHRLIRDETGKRLAKRDDARAIAKYRDEGATPKDIRTLVGL